MPQNAKRKCDRCNKLKNDLELCGDDLLCRSCEVQNAVELTKIKLCRNVQNDVVSEDTNFSISTAGAQQPAKLDVSCVASQIVFNELLTYVYFYRGRSTAENIKKVLLHFYTGHDISAAKKEIISLCHMQSVSLDVVNARRSSSQRPASEAEVEDILLIFDVLDNLSDGPLQDIKFAASSLDRLPKYGPEEINICSVIDHQVLTDARMAELISNDACAKTSPQNIQINKMEALLADLNHTSSQLESASQKITTQLVLLDKVIENGHEPRRDDKSVSSMKSSADRALNVVISGVAEDKQPSEWRNKVAEGLAVAAGRHVDIADAFRLGRFQQGRTRPVLVKLRSIWDKRVVLSNSRTLGQHDQPDFIRRMFISPDEPLEVRRKNMLKRIRIRAEREGKLVRVSDDGNCLYVNDSLVFSIDANGVGSVSAS